MLPSNHSPELDLCRSGFPRGRAATSVAVWLGVASVALVLGATVPAGAQQSLRTLDQRAEGKVDESGRAASAPRRQGFKLFAEEDLAGSGLKMTGTFGWYVTNTGPCSF